LSPVYSELTRQQPGPDRHTWAPASLQYIFKNFLPTTGISKFLMAQAQTANYFWRNYFTCGNLSLLAPYFRLFRWLLTAP